MPRAQRSRACQQCRERRVKVRMYPASLPLELACVDAAPRASAMRRRKSASSVTAWACGAQGRFRGPSSLI